MKPQRGHRPIALAAAAALPLSAGAQCVPEWRAYSGPHLDAPVFTLTTWERDISGPEREVVVAGGNFSGAGSSWTGQAALWDGAQWHRMGAGVVGTTYATAVYAHNGVSGTAQPVIGGLFTHSASTVINRIARFDGTSWQPFGAGVSIPGSTFNATVYSLAVHHGDLIAGGIFTQAGNVPAEGIARWDGQDWHAFPGNYNTAFALGSQGGQLYIGGWFEVPGGTGTFDRTGILVGRGRNQLPPR
jgi:hypothetical protein